MELDSGNLMRSDTEFNPTPVILRLDSLSALRIYLKRILEHYQEDVDKYGDTSANLMREIAKRSLTGSSHENSSRNSGTGSSSPPWSKLGPLFLDTQDPLLGTNELVLQALEESQFKMSQTLKVLKTFDEVQNAGVSEESSLLLYLRNGVPDRLVAEPLFGT